MSFLSQDNPLYRRRRRMNSVMMAVSTVALAGPGSVGVGVNAAFTSLLASCALHEIEPWSYLRDLFCLLP